VQRFHATKYTIKVQQNLSLCDAIHQRSHIQVTSVRFIIVARKKLTLLLTILISRR